MVATKGVHRSELEREVVAFPIDCIRLIFTKEEALLLQTLVEGASHARLLAEALKVVAVGGRYQAQSSSKRLSESSTDRYSSLTLEVPAALVESVLSAQSLGRVVALLRPDPSTLKSGHGRVRGGAGNAQPKQKPVEVIVHSGLGEAQ